MKRKFLAYGTALAGLALVAAAPSFAMGMKEAVRIAVDSNPEIGEAIASREGIEFELEQGYGLYRPRVDLEGSLGGEIRDNETTDNTDDNDHLFFRKQASVVVRQLLFDGFGTQAEIEHQASRVDGASFRVTERSEFIALSVIREYLEIIRLHKILAFSKENISYHKKILGDVTQGTSGGTMSIADRQQAEERVYSAKAAYEAFVEELKAAETAFIRLVGEPVGKVGAPVNVRNLVPKSRDAALKRARQNHPSIKLAVADIDAATAQVKAAESKFYPTFALEGRAIAADDVDGQRGFDGDLRADLVMNWNIYNGGIDTANKQEQIRHVDENYQKLNRITREVEEGVRLSWDRQVQQSRRLRELLRELSTVEQLRTSYFEQFRIGQRSLLDLLDTQNNRFSAQISVATADADVKFAQFRILASTGELLPTLGIPYAHQAKAYARDDARVPETPSPDSFNRVEPDRPE